MALLYGRAGRLAALFGGFRPGQWPARWSCNASYSLRHPRWEPAACEVVPSRLLGSNVTYRYGASRVLYPFGFGLSYATFAFSHLKHAASDGEAGFEGSLATGRDLTTAHPVCFP